jgi:TonB family protein
MSRFLAVAALSAVSLGLHAQDVETLNLIKSGEQAVRRADYAEADVFYAKAAARGDSAEVVPALWYLGTRAAGQGNRPAAEGFFGRLLRIDSTSAVAARSMTWLGNLRQADDPAGAESLFKQAASLQEPGTRDAQETARSYAFLLRRQGRLAEADAMEKASARGISAGQTSASALPPGVHRVGGGVLAPRLLAKVEPQYTEEARQGRLQGTVLLSVDIDPSGTATNVEVQRSLEPGLDQKAIEAVRQWRFKPGMKDGAAVTVRATIEVNFRLN